MWAENQFQVYQPWTQAGQRVYGHGNPNAEHMGWDMFPKPPYQGFGNWLLTFALMWASPWLGSPPPVPCLRTLYLPKPGCWRQSISSYCATMRLSAGHCCSPQCRLVCSSCLKWDQTICFPLQPWMMLWSQKDGFWWNRSSQHGWQEAAVAAANSSAGASTASDLGRFYSSGVQFWWFAVVCYIGTGCAGVYVSDLRRVLILSLLASCVSQDLSLNRPGVHLTLHRNKTLVISPDGLMYLGQLVCQRKCCRWKGLWLNMQTIFVSFPSNIFQQMWVPCVSI